MQLQHISITSVQPLNASSKKNGFNVYSLITSQIRLLIRSPHIVWYLLGVVEIILFLLLLRSIHIAGSLINIANSSRFNENIFDWSVPYL